MRDNGRQQGQVLVIFAGALVLLLLIAALVFDLGMSWMVRRQEQNAADPAALAAAKYVPSVALPLGNGNNATAEMVAAACYYAGTNGFFPSGYDLTSTGCRSKTNPQDRILAVFYPPNGPSAGSYAGRPGYVQVVITQQRQNFFLGLIGQTVSTVTASAVAANTTGDSNSYSLLALDPGRSVDSGKIGGNSGGSSSDGTKVSIVPAIDPSTGTAYSGGYVQVNSTYPSVPSAQGVATCPSGNGALSINGSGSLTAPQISVTGQCGGNNDWSTNTGLINEGALQVGDPLADLLPPDPTSLGLAPGTCGIGGATVASGSTGCGSNGGSMDWKGTSCTVNGFTSKCVSLQPGVYYGGWTVSNNITLDLAAGIYYIAGRGISVTGTGAITSVSGSSGPAPVMIFSSDDPDPTVHAACLAGTAAHPQFQCQGPIDLNAQTTLALAGMDSGPYKGILLWQDGNGSCVGSNCDVQIGGQANLTLSGTIYAPRVQVQLDGGSSGTGVASIQIISWQWTFIGGSLLTMPYDPNKLYHLEQRGLVH